MTQTLFGPWAVEVVALNADFGERLLVSGSDNSDGDYAATPGFRVDVAGEEWTLELQWNDHLGSGWQPSSVQRSAAYQLDSGLVLTLGVDDNWDAVRDHDYDDVVLTCTSKDPDLSPPRHDPPPDFTISEDQLRQRSDNDPHG